MTGTDFEMTANLLEKHLEKSAREFTKADIIKFVQDNNIEMVNFRYPAEDGKLKNLNFVINSIEHLDNILTTGERVDGSSLFSFIGAGSSDLYVVPRFRTAFVNPFEHIPTLDILCSFYTHEGKPLETAPEYVLKKAHDRFRKKSGMEFKALGELEYYVMSEKNECDVYPAVDQKGYHSSHPYTKFDGIRKEAMKLIAESGGKIKYGHSEVGNFSTEDMYYEQQEIEFLPCDVMEAAEQMLIAKWILRRVSHSYGVEISFAPKITVGKAGSGLHIHMLAEKDGKNMMVENAALSDIAKKMIAGILDLSGALTAFGNTIPTSYLRLVPHQEAPTNICWGDRNRSVLVRVPLGWLGSGNMLKDANPAETDFEYSGMNKQTVELRSGDGSADIYNFLSGIVVAAVHGLEMPDALQKANELYVDVNIFDDAHKDKLEQLDLLPDSCWSSAEELEKKRKVFESSNVFPAGMIDDVIRRLRAHEDKDLSERLYGKHDEIAALVNKYLHCM